MIITKLLLKLHVFLPKTKGKSNIDLSVIWTQNMKSRFALIIIKTGIIFGSKIWWKGARRFQTLRTRFPTTG